MDYYEHYTEALIEILNQCGILSRANWKQQMRRTTQASDRVVSSFRRSDCTNNGKVTARIHAGLREYLNRSQNHTLNVKQTLEQEDRYVRAVGKSI